MNRKAFLTALALSAAVFAAALAALAAPAAHAALTVGASQAATVTCDSFTNQLQVQARIAVSSNQTQRVAYQLYAYNLNTGRRTDLFINGQGWHVLTHQPVTGSWEWSIPHNQYEWSGSTNYWANTPNLTYTLADGRYYVYVRYAWEANSLFSGIWLDATGARLNDSSPWVRTTGYQQVYSAGYWSDCSL
jgi:hypothetical protein